MFDDRLKLLRNSKNLSSKEVAQMLNLKERTYKSYENNEREPDSEVLIKIARLFDVSIDYLLNFDIELINQGSSLKFSTKEINLVKAYRTHQDMQKAVDILLGITESQPQRIVQTKAPEPQQIFTVREVARHGQSEEKTLSKGYLDFIKANQETEDSEL